MNLRRWGKKSLVTVLAFVVLAATVAYILRFTPLVPDQIARAFTENLLRERGYRLQIATVRGNPLGDLVLTQARLLADRDGEREVARVRQIEIRVHPLNLLRGRVEVRELKLIEPYVHVGGDGIRGDLLAPRAPAPRAPMPLVRLRNLRIENGHVAWTREGSVVRAQSLSGRFDLELDSRGAELRIESLAARIDPYVTVKHARGRLVWADDSLVCDEVDVTTPMSHLAIAGSWVPSERRMRLEGNVDPLHFDELEAFVALPVKGRLHGPFTVVTRDSLLDFNGTWSGQYQEYAAHDVAIELRLTPGVFDLRHARGTVAERPVELRVRVAGEGMQGTAQVDALDLRRLDARFPETRLSGTLAFARPAADDTLELDLNLGRSRVDAWQLESLRARVGVRERSAIVRRGTLRRTDGGIQFGGRIAERAMDLDWRAQVDDLGALLAPWGVDALQARLDAAGSLSGDPRAPALAARGTFTDAVAPGVRAAGGEFEIHSEDLVAAPLHCELQGERLEVAGRTLNRFSSQLEWDPERVLHIRRAEASRGDTLVALVAELRTVARDWLGEARPTQQVRLETALIQAGAQEVRVEDPATVRWHGRQVRVDSLRVVTRGGSMRLDGALDLESTAIDARSEVRDFDLDFLGQAMRLDSTLAGVATGWFEAHGSLERTLVDARVDVRDGRWNTLDFDSVRVDVQSDAFGVQLRLVKIDTPHGDLRGSGRLGYLPSLQRWLASQEGARSRAELEDAQVEATLDYETLEVERFWSAVRVGEAPAWRAVLSGRTTLSGSVGAPRLASTGAARAVRVGPYAVDSLRFEVRYADGALGVPALDVHAARTRLEARGQLPLRLHLARRATLDHDADLEAHLRIEEGSFAVVPRFISFFEPATRDVPVGTVRAQLDVRGSLDAPELRGEVAVRNAGFTLAGLEEIYRDASMVGVFEGNTLRMTDIQARTGSDGRIRGNGTLSFDGLRVADYRFALTGTKVSIYSVPQMAATVSGQIDIRATLLDNDALVPDFRGALRIEDATITQEFTGDGESSALLESTDQPSWIADVTLDAPGRVRVKNSNADAELSGSVQLVRNRAGLDVQGEAQVKRGQYTVYLERFEITRGDLDFSRHPGWEPELDLEARRGRIGDRIYVHLTGTPSAPNLTFTGDAPGTAEDYQDRLIGGDRDLAADAASVASAVAEQALVDLRYIDSFSINPEAAGSGNASGEPRAYNVSAGWEVSDRVFVTYTQGLNESDLKQSVTIELDLLRNLLLQSSWEKRNFPTLENQPDATQDAFDFDLKFRWEY